MADSKKLSFLIPPILNIFFCENFDDYPGFQPKTTPAQRYATQCKSCHESLMTKKHFGKGCKVSYSAENTKYGRLRVLSHQRRI